MAARLVVPTCPVTKALCSFVPLSTAAVLLHVCSLSVSAEPFGSPPHPIPLDLLALPPGLTSLELRNVHITTSPAALAGAAEGSAIRAEPEAASSCSSPAVQTECIALVGGSVLHHLACLKLESCRLRAPQLKVRGGWGSWLRGGWGPAGQPSVPGGFRLECVGQLCPCGLHLLMRWSFRRPLPSRTAIQDDLP